MCDEFVCSDSGVGLCEADRKLLERLGSRNPRTKGDGDKGDTKGDTKGDGDKAANGDTKGDTKGDSEHGGDTDNNNNQEETNRNFDKDRGSHLFGNCSRCSVSRSWCVKC